MTSTVDLLNLYTAYAVGLDTQNAELFVNCFTQDAVIDSPAQLARGHDEIVAWMALTPAGMLHQSFNIMVVDDSNPEISCRADWLVYDGGAPISRGTYRDLVRTDHDGALRFSERSIVRTWRRSTPPSADEADLPSA